MKPAYIQNTRKAPFGADARRRNPDAALTCDAPPIFPARTDSGGTTRAMIAGLRRLLQSVLA